MKYMDTLYDYQIEKEYKLYRANAREISERLHADYGLDPITLQTFNSDSKLGHSMRELKSLIQKGYANENSEEDHWRFREIESIKKKILNNEHIPEVAVQGATFGYEIMPIAVSVTGDIEDPNTKLELIDGFKRMFCVPDIPDREIMVKVYEQLDDREWINSMIVYNSWKFADGNGADSYMDRGFQLGLYHRYGIYFADMVLPNWDMFSAINIYTNGSDLRSYWGKDGNIKGIYMTFWNNPCFHHDIQAIYQIMTHKPTYLLKKRGKPVEEIQGYGWGLQRILEVFVSVIGQVRRAEHRQHITNQKPFELSYLVDYFAKDELQKDFIHLKNMSVDGFIINYVRDHLRDGIKSYVFERMGYKWEPPVIPPKEPMKPFKLSEIHL